jgi:hypothetical protein
MEIEIVLLSLDAGGDTQHGCAGKNFPHLESFPP